MAAHPNMSRDYLRGAVVDAGLLSAEEAEATSARFGENMRVCTPVMMAGIGRRR